MATRASSESGPITERASISEKPAGVARYIKAEDIQSGEGEIKVDPSSYAPTDGGWDAWSTVFGTTLVSFGTFG